jgi:hypothetical protein
MFSTVSPKLYYERGRGAYFRSTMIGANFIQNEAIAGGTPDEVISGCISALKTCGIIKDGTFRCDASGRLYTITFKESLHLQVDQRLMADGVPPYICPPANMILHLLRERFGLAVEIAAIRLDIEQKKHIVDVVVFNMESKTEE